MIAIAMSGGVDSSAAAVLLRESGEPLVGLSMQLWNQRRALNGEEPTDVQRTGRCCSLDDIWDARRVASHLGIPFYVLNLEDQFESTVIAPFVATYMKGETPSPCILCNNFVKFNHLVDRAAGIGADRVATGHYARVRYDEALGRWLLLRGKDRKKDQSYFLFGLTQTQLSKTVFPLGELTKPEVREIARNAGLPTYDKPESQEICFVQGRSYAEFVEKYAGIQTEQRGEIVNLGGEVVGGHEGIHNYTIGQRKGLGAAGKPQYVVKIEPQTNRVVIGDDPDLLRKKFAVRDVNWIAVAGVTEPIACQVQIRNRFEPQPARLMLEDGRVVVEFETPQRAVTPGQGAVFYWDDVVVGGGWIVALNYFNYFTEIEQFYQTKRDVFTLLSTLDWVLIENWKEAGVPLEVVLQGIDRAFSRANAKKRINSLAYCVKAVEEVIGELKDARPEKAPLPEIPAEETQKFLEDLAEKTLALGKVFPEFAGKITGVADSVRVVDVKNFRDAEQVLGALEEKLIAILRVAAEESALIEVKREVEGELAPVRSTMTTEQLAMLEQQLSRRKLLERFNVPRLSLFYLM